VENTVPPESSGALELGNHSVEGQFHSLERTQRIDCSIDEVFEFFADAGNLEALTPSFLHFRILTPLPIEMKQGSRIDYALRLFAIPLRWRTRIAEWVPGRRFTDEQESGPFKVWSHTHEFEDCADHVLMRDRVHYMLPLGAIGRLLHALVIERTLVAIFDFRSRAIAELLGSTAGDAQHSEQSPTT
jgi:ligand-binding SRPBCC domain-containing protein